MLIKNKRPKRVPTCFVPVSSFPVARDCIYRRYEEARFFSCNVKGRKSPQKGKRALSGELHCSVLFCYFFSWNKRYVLEKPAPSYYSTPRRTK